MSATNAHYPNTNNSSSSNNSGHAQNADTKNNSSSSSGHNASSNATSAAANTGSNGKTSEEVMEVIANCNHLNSAITFSAYMCEQSSVRIDDYLYTV
jgi:hypothetical protein